VRLIDHPDVFESHQRLIRDAALLQRFGGPALRSKTEMASNTPCPGFLGGVDRLQNGIAGRDEIVPERRLVPFSSF
jgi:hypothetical protein